MFATLAIVPPAGAVSVTEFAIPRDGARPTDITAGPDGSMWYVDSGFESDSPRSKIGRVEPSTGRVEEFAAAGFATEIAVAQDGRLWLLNAFSYAGTVQVVDPRSPTISQVPGLAGAYAFDVDVGGDGGVWVTTPPRGLKRFDPVTLEQRSFSLPGAPGGFGNYSHAVWGAADKLYLVSDFLNSTEPFPHHERPLGYIKRVDPSSGSVEASFRAPVDGIFDPIAGANGDIWFLAESSPEGSLERFEAATGDFTEHTLGLSAPHADIFGIAASPDGSIWATHEGGVTRLDPRSGRLGHWAIPTFSFTSTNAASPAFAPDGRLWFVDPYAGNVGRVELDGEVDIANMDTVLGQGLSALLDCEGNGCRGSVDALLLSRGQTAPAGIASRPVRRRARLAHRSVRARGRGVRPVRVRFTRKAKRLVRRQGGKALLDVVVRVRERGARRARVARRTVVLKRYRRR